jgi:hypothetical protein
MTFDMNSTNSPDPGAAESFLSRQLARLPPRAARITTCALSLTAGIAIAVVLHYVLYRVGLPSKPFIYVAF